MQKFSRYLLAGWLVACMTVDTASAGRIFRSLCCRPACQPACVEICPPVKCCPPVECCSAEEAPEAPIPASLEPQPSPSGSSTREPVASPKAATDQPATKEDGLESAIFNEPTPAPLPVSESTPEAAPVPAPASEPAVAPQPIPESETPASSESNPEPSVDSLFDEPAAPVAEPESVPVVAPEEKDSADGLFDEPAAPAENAAADSLFDEPTPEPAPEEKQPAETDPLDSLFPAAIEESPEEDPLAPAEAEETEEPSSSEASKVEDLFGQQELPLFHDASQTTRQWTSRDARFGCEARLDRVTAKTVVLLKTDGKKVAVPFSRLSNSDLRFVHQQVVDHRELLAKRAAADLLASRWSE